MDGRSTGALRETSAQIFLIDTSNDGSYTAFCFSRIGRRTILLICGLRARPTHAVGIHGSSGTWLGCSSISRLSHCHTVEEPWTDGMGEYITCSGGGSTLTLYWLYGL